MADPTPVSAPGTIHVVLDEAFDPATAVGAVVIEDYFSRLNENIQNLYKELEGDYYLNGLESFEKFLNEGFHASTSAREVSLRFVSFLAKTIGFKSFIYFSNGERRDDLSPNKKVLLMYGELLKVIIRKHRHRPQIVLYFEQNDALNRYFEPLVHQVLRNVKKPRPVVRTYIAKKMHPQALAVVDYVLKIFLTWYFGGSANATYKWPPKSRNPQDGSWREMRAIVRSLSYARSLEEGTVQRRSLPGGADGTMES